jgi:hypothetical protein
MGMRRHEHGKEWVFLSAAGFGTSPGPSEEGVPDLLFIGIDETSFQG